MGRSSSSSQANQATTSSNTDRRVVNESGIVAQDSFLDMSTSNWANLTSTSNTNTNLQSWDSSNRSTNLSTADSHNTSNSTANWSSLTSNDNSNRSTNLSTADSHNSSNWSSLADSHNSSDWTSLTDSHNSSSWDASTTNTNTTSGSYNTTLDPAVAKAALDYASNNDATVGAGFNSLLGWAKELSADSTNSANNMVSRFTDGVAQAFDSARNTTPGGIDNKTMIILGVAGAAAVGLAMASRKGS